MFASESEKQSKLTKCTNCNTLSCTLISIFPLFNKQFHGCIASMMCHSDKLISNGARTCSSIHHMRPGCQPAAVLFFLSVVPFIHAPSTRSKLPLSPKIFMLCTFTIQIPEKLNCAFLQLNIPISNENLKVLVMFSNIIQFV